MSSFFCVCVSHANVRFFATFLWCSHSQGSTGWNNNNNVILQCTCHTQKTLWTKSHCFCLRLLFFLSLQKRSLVRWEFKKNRLCWPAYRKSPCQFEAVFNHLVHGASIWFFQAANRELCDEPTMKNNFVCNLLYLNHGCDHFLSSWHTNKRRPISRENRKEQSEGGKEGERKKSV